MKLGPAAKHLAAKAALENKESPSSNEGSYSFASQPLTLEDHARDDLSAKDESTTDIESVLEDYDPVDYVTIDPSCCRVLMSSRGQDGSMVRTVCGNPASTCTTKGHFAKVSAGEREKVGAYPRHISRRGSTKHGVVGSGYKTLEAMREEHAAAAERMAQLMSASVVPDEDGSVIELMDPPDKATQVSFGKSTVQGAPFAVPKKLAPVSRTKAPPEPQQGPRPFIGLVHVGSGDRIVTSDPATAQALEDSGLLKQEAIFMSEVSAEAWKSAGGTQTQGSQPEMPVSDDDEDHHDNRRRHRRHKKANRRKGRGGRRSRSRAGRRRSRGYRRRRSGGRKRDDSSSSEGDGSSHGGGDGGWSSDGSSSVSSGSDTSKSSVSSARARTGHRASARPSGLHGPDPSVGDKERVYKHALNGSTIDVVVGPKDLSSKDAADLFDCAADITAINGKSASHGKLDVGGDDDEHQRSTEMAASLLSTALGKRATYTDSLWQSRRRHALGQVKTFDDLLEFCQGVSDQEVSAFEREGQQLHQFLARRRFSSSAIRRFREQGGLVRITRLTYQHYFALLSHLQQLAFQHRDTEWKESPAFALLTHHSTKLLRVRENAISRKHLILGTYVYLRDSSAKSFYHESMTKTLWTKLAKVTTTLDDAEHFKSIDEGNPPEEETGPTKKKKAQRCNHCRRRGLHEAFQKTYLRQSCPLKLEKGEVARAAAIKFMELFGEGDNAQEVLNKCIEEARSG